jgi:hypothetical protein
MPRTGGRGAGEGGQNPTGAVEAANRKGISPIQVEPHPWRAVCYESSLHGSGRDGWKRVYSVVNVQLSRYRAGHLLHLGTFPTERMAFWQRSRGPGKTFAVDERFWLGMLGQDGMFVTHP